MSAEKIKELIKEVLDDEHVWADSDIGLNILTELSETISRYGEEKANARSHDDTILEKIKSMSDSDKLSLVKEHLVLIKNTSTLKSQIAALTVDYESLENEYKDLKEEHKACVKQTADDIIKLEKSKTMSSLTKTIMWFAMINLTMLMGGMLVIGAQKGDIPDSAPIAAFVSTATDILKIIVGSN